MKKSTAAVSSLLLLGGLGSLSLLAAHVRDLNLFLTCATRKSFTSAKHFFG
ncbi:hypothetical protein LRS06_21280 [Hymenobacter sp. J193]|uniref:hypothetical protein n=1 Tax=Hymenobacter sp. J193 TaxID=2898429 RepID=UPI0021519D42|nr:hypothetical protein [Hymenobacter sp. J193]MCR5890262.1 hypothetical protein [Hymenobacter sp. J193]